MEWAPKMEQQEDLLYLPSGLNRGRACRTGGRPL